MDAARLVQREKGAYLTLANAVKTYMQKKGLWVR
jgi:hypothetical protein